MNNKILLADDEVDIQTIAKLSLETMGGFEVEVVNNGKEVLEKLTEYKPDLIILDLMMPEMDGRSALVKITEHPEFKKIPVVFMTAKVQSHEVQDYLSLGAVDVIPKPFDPVNLPEQIKKIMVKNNVR